jgi:hypothetical protein
MIGLSQGPVSFVMAARPSVAEALFAKGFWRQDDSPQVLE